MTNPELTAAIAELDQRRQRRAHAEQVLAEAIKDYRDRIDGADETLAFVSLVWAVGQLVDPNDVLDNEHSNRLAKIAECFACAVSRLIKAGAQ